MIIHTVALRLRHPDRLSFFLNRIETLSTIPGVKNFEVLKQVGKKNNFTHALSMRFIDQEAYDAYNCHPDHIDFVQNVWVPEVEDFIELDYVGM